MKITKSQLKRIIKEATEEYAATAEEEAKKRSEDYPGLVTDQSHWDEYDVKTGEDLARHLAVAQYIDLYKELEGIKPRWMNFDAMSISEIEDGIEELFRSHSEIDEYDPPPLDWEEVERAGEEAVAEYELMRTPEEGEEYPKRRGQRQRGRRPQATPRIPALTRERLRRIICDVLVEAKAWPREK